MIWTNSAILRFSTHILNYSLKKINSNAPTNDDCDANVTLCLPHINKTLCLIRYYQVITALVSLYFRILANYIVWNVIQDEVSFLSKPYRKARTQYRERVLGSKGQKKRWKTCVTFTNELLGDILGSAYVEHHFSNSSKKMVRKESYLILLQAQKLTRHLKTKKQKKKNNNNNKKLDQP